MQDRNRRHAFGDAFQDPREDLSFLVERPDILDQVSNALSDPIGPPVVLVGPPGVGKTTIIRLYLYKHSEEFHGVTFISARELAQDLAGQPEATLLLFRRRIAKAFGEDDIGGRSPTEYLNSVPSNRRHLLIIDGLDELSNNAATRMLQVIPYQHPRLAVFIAARPYFTDRLGAIAGRSQVWLKIAISTPSLQQLHDLVLHRVTYARQDERIAERFFTELAQRNVSVESLRPRFALQLLQHYIHSSSVDQALIDTALKYFPRISALAVAETSDGVLVFPTSDGEPAGLLSSNGSIFTGVPLIVIKGARNLWGRQIQEFEELIGGGDAKEGMLQAFFERYPHFLQGIEYADVYPQVVLEREDEGNLIPDFLLRPLASPYVDVLDLKLPTEHLIVGGSDRKRFGAAVQSAIAQVREYRNYFERSEYREKLRRKYGISAYRPKCIVVIGTRPSEIPEKKVRQLLDEVPRYLTLMTYDDLLIRMKEQAFKHGI